MRLELVQNGPIVSSIHDLDGVCQASKNGIYRHVKSSQKSLKWKFEPFRVIYLSCRLIFVDLINNLGGRSRSHSCWLWNRQKDERAFLDR